MSKHGPLLLLHYRGKFPRSGKSAAELCHENFSAMHIDRAIGFYEKSWDAFLLSFMARVFLASVVFAPKERFYLQVFP